MAELLQTLIAPKFSVKYFAEYSQNDRIPMMLTEDLQSMRGDVNVRARCKSRSELDGLGEDQVCKPR